jgi:hypothetical protein
MRRVCIDPFKDSGKPLNCHATGTRRPAGSQKDRMQSCLTGANDVPFWMIPNERCLMWLNAEQLKSFLEWSPVRLAPTDICANHDCVDMRVQAVSADFVMPRLGRASPGCV